MDTITAIFTVRPWNPVSLAIRCVTPRSLFCKAQASHVIVLDGDTGYAMEASMLHGVRRVVLEEALAGLMEVARVSYEVPDAEAGLAWMRITAERRAPYDWSGALGLGLAPDRNWQEDSSWFCFEFLANGLDKAGRKLFNNNGHVTADKLLSVPPALTP